MKKCLIKWKGRGLMVSTNKLAFLTIENQSNISWRSQFLGKTDAYCIPLRRININILSKTTEKEIAKYLQKIRN